MEIKIPIYNDIWFDNGIITFYTILKDIQEDAEDEKLLDRLELTQTEMFYSWKNTKFLDFLKRKIIAARQRLILEVIDEKTSVKKEIKKDHILIQEGKKIAEIVALKEDIYKKSKTEQIIEDIYTSLAVSKKSCFLCNRHFKIAIKKMQQASYPFVTKIKSLSGTRSGKDIKLYEYYTDYCPQCYLNGIIEWIDESLIYRTLPKIKSIIILPGSNNLKELYGIKKEYIKLLNNNDRWCNIKTEFLTRKNEDVGKVERPPDRYSTLISFYENFLRFTNSKHKDWYIIEIPSGSVKNPKYFHIKFGSKCINILKSLFKEDELLFYRIFIKGFYAFNADLKKGLRDYERENELREEMCQAIINSNLETFCRCFIPKKGVYIRLAKGAYRTLERLLYHWRIKEMDLENKEEYIKLLQMGGQTIASIIDNGKRLNLFFKLEKAKTKSKFLEAMQEISRRLIIDKDLGKVYTPAIDKIIGMIETNYDRPGGKEFFKDTKNMLLIYTSIKAKQSSYKKEMKED